MAEAMLQAAMSAAPASQVSVGGTCSQDSDLRSIIADIAKLLLIHDRDLQDHNDRTAMALLARDAEFKQQIVTIRESWQKAKPPPPEPGQAAKPHPMACSLRSLIHSAFVVNIEKKVGKMEEGEAKIASVEAVTWLKRLSTQEVEQCVFRFKPRFYHPHADQTRSWTWMMTFAITCDPNFIKAWYTLASRLSVNGIAVRPAKSQDGALAKKLRDFVKASPTAAIHDPADKDDDDEMESDEGAKRRKGRNGGS